jgi:putative ABC transport system permease protein
VNWTARQPGVSASQGIIGAGGKLLTEDGRVFNLTLTAYSDFENATINRLQPETGAWPPQPGTLYVERSYAERLGIQIGDLLTVELADGRRQELTFGGTIYDFSVRPGGLQSVVSGYVSPETLHRIGLSANYNRLAVTVEDGLSVSDTANALMDSLQRLDIRVTSVNINTEGHWATGIFDGISTVLVFVGFASLLLSAFLVINTISGFMAQQKRPIGIMKIIGASRPQIIGVYMVMVALFGALALVVALPASFLFGRGLTNYIAPRLNLSVEQFSMPAFILILEVIVAFGTPMLAALFPILGGTRVPPAQAISDYNVQSSNNPLDVLLARLKGISRPALLSIRNTFRRKLRLLVTLVTLVLAGAFFISIINVRSGLNADLGILGRMSEFDAQFSLSGRYSEAAVERRALELPGVTTAEGWVAAQVAQVLPDGTQSSNFSLTGLPYNSALIDPPMLAGRWLEAPAYSNRYDLVVSDTLQSDANVEIGDTLTLKAGDTQQNWRVVGIYDGFGAAAYSYDTTVARLIERPDQLDRLMVRAAGATSVLAQQFEQALEAQGIEVAQTTLRADIIQGIVGGFNVLVLILLAMAILIALVAGLGLTGTMSLNVLERTREIGVMRAVGAGTNTIRLMFVGEGVLVGLLSFLVALPLSYPATLLFGSILGQVIFKQSLTYAPTVQGPLIWLALVMLVSTIASIAPAQRASQISIREALAYE